MLRPSLRQRVLGASGTKSLFRSAVAVIAFELGCSLIAPLEDVPEPNGTATSGRGGDAGALSAGGTSVGNSGGSRFASGGATTIGDGGSQTGGDSGASGGATNGGAPSSAKPDAGHGGQDNARTGGAPGTRGASDGGSSAASSGGSAGRGGVAAVGGGMAGESGTGGGVATGGGNGAMMALECEDEAQYFGMGSDSMRCTTPALWKFDHPVPYESISDWSESEREQLQHALTAWTLAAPQIISFFELEPNKDVRPRLRFVAGDRCWAPFGQTLVNGVQEVSLRGCDEATTQRELGRVLGMLNEQQRADRDRYLAVREPQLCSDPEPTISRRHFSEIVSHCAPEGPPLAQQTIGPYDFDSIMQAPSRAPTGGTCTEADTSGCDLVKRSGNAFVPGPTPTPLAGGGFSYISPLDAASFIERYHAAHSKWSAFQPMVRADPDPTQPLDTRLTSEVRLVGSPAIARWGTSGLIALVRGDDRHLYYKVYASDDDTWSVGDWTDLGGDFISDPAAVSRKEHSLDFVAVKANGYVYHGSYEDGVWSAATESLGRPNRDGVSAPAIAAWDSDRLDVFIRSGRTLYQKSWQEAGWEAWKDVSSSLQIQGKPSAASWGPNRIDVVAVSID
ncbi:MAG TPA: M12 family metallopeptidase, partial [Polyangiaceae bacterium]|nr:M12 family metallopeptidase [Polyangiaceae bacterium]